MARLGILGLWQPPKRWTRAKNVEVGANDLRAAQLTGGPLARQRGDRRIGAASDREKIRAPEEISGFADGEPEVAQAECREVGPDDNESIDVRNVERPKQDRVHRAADGDVCADR